MPILASVITDSKKPIVGEENWLLQILLIAGATRGKFGPESAVELPCCGETIGAC